MTNADTTGGSPTVRNPKHDFAGELVEGIADALRAANPYPARIPGAKNPNEWARTVEEITRRDAEAVVPAVVTALRGLAREWRSSDLMDAAAWMEGTL